MRRRDRCAAPGSVRSRQPRSSSTQRAHAEAGRAGAAGARSTVLGVRGRPRCRDAPRASSPTKCHRNAAAVIVPPSRPPICLDVGHLAAHVLAVHVPERQRPGALAGRLAGARGSRSASRSWLPSTRGRPRAERDRARAGERGEVDDRRRARTRSSRSGARRRARAGPRRPCCRSRSSCPTCCVTMSSGRYAVPLGMFSTAPTTPTTCIGSSSSAHARSAPITAAPPDMSCFIVVHARGRA